MEDRCAEPGSGLQGAWQAGCPSTGQDIASSYKAAGRTLRPQERPRQRGPGPVFSAWPAETGGLGAEGSPRWSGCCWWAVGHGSVFEP